MSDVFTPFHVDTEGWRAAFPGKFVPMCRIGGKCACFRAKTVEISGHLLAINQQSGKRKKKEHRSDALVTRPNLSQ
jgi:hypothetical protein